MLMYVLVLLTVIQTQHHVEKTIQLKKEKYKLDICSDIFRVF